jgi:hypothetical protein
MERLAKFRGPKAFMAAVKEFLAQAPWFESRGEYLNRLMPYHEWDRFCDNFELYLGDHKRRLDREAAEAAANLRWEEEQRNLAEAQRKLEQDPEYIRQREEDRRTWEKNRAARELAAAEARQQRSRKAQIDLLRKRFAEVTQDHEYLEDPQESTWYAIRDLLHKMAGDDSKQFSQHEEDFEVLLRKLENLTDNPS